MSAKYTITIQEMIENEGVDIFDFGYVLSSKVDKEYLEGLFIKKYYFREICYETISMWLFHFRYEWENRLRLYNELFDKEYDLLRLDPLIDFEENEIEQIIRDIQENEFTTSSGSSNLSGDEKLTTKDTPLSAYDDSNYVSGISTNKLEQEAESDVAVDKENTQTETIDKDRNLIHTGSYEKIVKYMNSLRDYVSEFINSFNNYFMGIY